MFIFRHTKIYDSLTRCEITSPRTTGGTYNVCGMLTPLSQMRTTKNGYVKCVSVSVCGFEKKITTGTLKQTTWQSFEPFINELLECRVCQR